MSMCHIYCAALLEQKVEASGKQWHAELRKEVAALQQRLEQSMWTLLDKILQTQQKPFIFIHSASSSSERSKCVSCVIVTLVMCMHCMHR